MKTSYQVESFTFTNNNGDAANGLTIVFDDRYVKVKDSGAFHKAATDDETVKLSRGSVTSDTSTTITFEKEGSFQIVSWYWTINGAASGAVKPGSPGQ